MKAHAIVLVGLVGCAPPAVEAPSDLTANLRWWWSNVEVAKDAELLDSAAKLAAAAEADTRTMVRKSVQPRLEAGDLTNVGLDTKNDPSKARGLLMLNVFDCTLPKLQQLLIEPDQKTAYPDVYESYSRTFTTDRAAFESGSANTLDWSVAMKVTLPVADTYEATVKGGLRRVPAPTESATKGPIIVARTWLPEPAKFADPNSASAFRQDYQIELYWEPAPGRIFHAYGMWREMRVGGFSLSLEDNGLVEIALNNMENWDKQTVELCKKL